MHAGEEDLDGQHQDKDRTLRGRVGQNGVFFLKSVPSPMEAGESVGLPPLNKWFSTPYE